MQNERPNWYLSGEDYRRLIGDGATSRSSTRPSNEVEISIPPTSPYSTPRKKILVFPPK